MGKLSQHILDELLKHNKKLLLVRNSDRFLMQEDRLKWLDTHGIKVVTGNSLKFRVFFETEFKGKNDTYKKVIFLVESEDMVLEDIRQEASFFEFKINDYLPEFHEEVTVSADMGLLNYLYDNKPLKSLGRNGSIKYVVENYYEVDADHFGTREAVLIKWVQLYQRGELIPEFVKEFLIQPSAKFVDEKNLKKQKSLFSYLQKEWKNYVRNDKSEIDFSHQRLAAVLNISFLNGLLDPLETKVSEPFKNLIPFGVKSNNESIDPEQLKVPLAGELAVERIRWESAVVPISEVIKKALKHRCYQEIDPLIQKLNKRFQYHLKKEYKENILPSSSINHPKVVSKVLDHISHNHQKNNKIALIVIDGMAYWQWLMVKNHIIGHGFKADQKLMYSWLPSITQLSRQAIFKGSTPTYDYRQSPANEKRLWESYWSKKNIPTNQIDYKHGSYNFQVSEIVNRFAFVDTALDEKMHSCSDYQDLYSLTENWIRFENLTNLIKNLKNSGFSIYLTTDHGNVQAEGWRNLRQVERFGANKSGSRSKRHLEYYVDESLADKFLNENPEIKQNIKKDGAVLYLQDNSAFSSDESLVTHGGSHLTEVLIPFVKIL